MVCAVGVKPNHPSVRSPLPRACLARSLPSSAAAAVAAAASPALERITTPPHPQDEANATHHTFHPRLLHGRRRDELSMKVAADLFKNPTAGGAVQDPVAGGAVDLPASSSPPPCSPPRAAAAAARRRRLRCSPLFLLGRYIEGLTVRPAASSSSSEISLQIDPINAELDDHILGLRGQVHKLRGVAQEIQSEAKYQNDFVSQLGLMWQERIRTEAIVLEQLELFLGCLVRNLG